MGEDDSKQSRRSKPHSLRKRTSSNRKLNGSPNFLGVAETTIAGVRQDQSLFGEVAVSSASVEVLGNTSSTRWW